MNLLNVAVTAVRVPTELAFGVAKGAVKAAYGLVAGSKEEEGSEWGPPAAGPPPTPARSRRAARPRNGNGRHQEKPAVAERPAPPAASEPAPPAPEPEEPAHVSEEPELVAEIAEEGAEDGAGAEVHVDEPWPGYDEMTAADIADRLVAEDTEVVAAVRLYEASTKGRAQVLEASARSLRA